MIGTITGRRPTRLLALAPIALMACAAQAQLSGAIYTSFKDGTTVNGNIYPSKEDVYLNGGPQNQNAAGLDDGIYFFQVTNPNGHDLLSTTKAWDRLIKVDGGRFAGRCHKDGSLITDDPVVPHDNGPKNLANQGISVQLAPFLDTPNHGGEYKAWVMIYKFEGSSTEMALPASDEKHVNFKMRYAKTDNFKIREKITPPQGFLAGTKFFDVNMNGVMDSNELPIKGFVIRIVLNGGNPVYVTTDQFGKWKYGPIDNGTTYKVSEILPPDTLYNGANASKKWIQTAPGTLNDPTDERGYEGIVNVPNQGDVIDGLDFGNTQVIKLSGIKFYDRNMNGKHDSGEELLENWPIKVKVTYPDGAVYTDTLSTDSNGAYTVEGLVVDSLGTKGVAVGSKYEISEVKPSNWCQTTPPDNLYSDTIDLAVAQGALYTTVAFEQPDITGLDFGNILKAKLKGVKFYDANMNGVKDSGEATIPGFTIKITYTKPGGSPTNDSKTTDSNGAFEFGPYPDGTTYSITETLPAGWKQTTTSPITGTLSTSGVVDSTTVLPDVTGLNIGNILLGKIKGVKFRDANLNGQFDSNETTLQGFTIKITGTQPDGTLISDSKVTDSNGAYEFGPYPDGTTYSITETVPAGWQQTTPSPVTGTITATLPITASSVISDVIVNVGNIKLIPLSGVKFYDKNYNGAKDSGEALLAGFTIKITYTIPGGSPKNDSTTTDSNGAYKFGPYPEGTTYSITEDVPAGWKRTTASPLTGTLSGDGPTDLDFGNILIAKIKGVKFYDYNMNKAKDGTDPVLAGFTIKISYTLPNGTTGTDSKVTGADGAFSFGPYPDGTSYSITETVPSGWLQTTSSPATGTLSAGSTITINTVLADATVNVGNIKLARLKGCKWYDTNGNGIKESGEPGIQGFKIVISYTKPNGSTGTETIYTDVNGNWQSKLYPEGTTYTVKEVMPPTGGWKQTYPAAPGTYSGTIKGGSTPTDNTYTVPDVTGLKFGNRVPPPISAHTKGYWHNQNGYATMNDGGTIVPEMTMLNNLPLVRLNGSAADFNIANPSAGFTDFSNWITNDSNGSNMACQLSAQLAAMKLNVEAGFVSGSQLLYAPGTSSANSLGIATLDDLMNEAIAALIANPITVNASAARTKQNAIMTALDKGNNNLNWLSLPIIIVPSPY